MKDAPLVTFIVIARNAASVLPGLLDDLSAQLYDHQKTELLFCDSSSKDETKGLFEAFAVEHGKEYAAIQVLDNPKATLPCGWNVCLSEAKGELILRVDAHSKLPVDFISKNVASYCSGKAVTGGLRISVSEENTPWQQTLLVAERSLFGSGLAFYRRAKEPRETDTVAHGAYARKVFETVGGYDERLTRTEDNEMHRRIRKAGFSIWMDPTIVSYHCARSSFKQMIRQKYGNGYWIGLTMGVSPACISLFHFAPFCLVLGLLIASAVALCGFPWLLVAGAGLYGLADLLMSVVAWIQEKPFHPQFLLLPFLFLILHFVYGIGTLAGLVYLPFWKPAHQTCAAKEETRQKMLANSQEREEA